MEKLYDVMVIGGGPAGSTAAFSAAKAGFSVLLIDKKKFPREKICAGGITTKCAENIIDIYGRDLFQSMVKRESLGARLEGTSKHMDVNNYGKVYYIERREMDNAFLKAAQKAGAEIYDGAKIVELDIENPAAKLQSGEKFKARYIIGADGAISMVRKKIRPDINYSYKMGAALTCKVPWKNGEDYYKAVGQKPVINLKCVKWGYGWIFPKGEYLSAGAGGLFSRQDKGALRGGLQTILKNINPELDVSKLKIRGAALPAGNYEKRPYFKNILLAGDAAGFVDPLTGEGLRFAVLSGKLAIESISKALENNKPRAAGKYYARICEKLIIKNLRRSKLIRLLIFSNFYKALLFFFPIKPLTKFIAKLL